MMERMLNINDVEVTNLPIEFICYGLGSCIGLFITDRMKKISGGAHIPLSIHELNGDFRGLVPMLEEMLEKFIRNGSDLNNLRAKVVGGAHVVEFSYSVGMENSINILQQLSERKIYLAAADLGGNVSRTARYNSMTYELRVSTSENKKYSI